MDKILSQPNRARIMAILSVEREVSFNLLKDILGLTDGNLSSHISKLQEAGYVEVIKSFEGKKPRTTVRITPEGDRALLKFIRDLKEFVDFIERPVLNT